MPVETLVPLRRIAAPTPSPESLGSIHFHPRYEHFLKRREICSATDALALVGEIVCGHPDRHVAKVKLKNRVVYLKREHLVGVRTRFRNALAGFGWVSKCEREAETLKSLESQGLPGPQWLAYGTDGEGRAFLLIDELPGDDIRGILNDNAMSPERRRQLIRTAARAMAAIHAAGFATPELAAKHLFVGPDRTTITLLDWQSAPRPSQISNRERSRFLAGLHASLSIELASSPDRLRFLREYLGLESRERTRDFARSILKSSAKIQDRSSVRDQRQRSINQSDQRLVWLQGEAVCVRPDLLPVWPWNVSGPPFYDDEQSQLAEEWLTFADGRRGLVVRFRSSDPLGRLHAAFRERPWRSPGATAGRILFHLERFNIPAPRLLAFGQRITGLTTAESFVAFQPTPDRGILREKLGLCSLGQRRELLNDAGAILRRLHDAGCRLVTTESPLFTLTASSDIELSSPFAVRLSKRISWALRHRDWWNLCSRELGPLSRTDRMRVAQGYDGSGRIARNWVL